MLSIIGESTLRWPFPITGLELRQGGTLLPQHTDDEAKDITLSGDRTVAELCILYTIVLLSCPLWSSQVKGKPNSNVLSVVADGK